MHLCYLQRRQILFSGHTVCLHQAYGLVHCHYLSWALVHSSEFFPHPHQEWFQISNKEYCPGVYFFDEIVATEIGFQMFSHSFLVIFSFILLVWWHQLPMFPSISNFSFLQEFLFFLTLAVLFLMLFVFFHFSSWTLHIFLYQIPFLYPSSIFLLFVSESNSFSSFANSFMLSMYINLSFCSLHFTY